MPRPRTPTAILNARGAFKKNPQRKRDGEPVVSTPVGNYSNQKVTPAECWHELTEAAPSGVLTGADRHNLEVASHLLAEFRADPLAMQTGRIALLNRLLGQFGMTPSDRAKLSIPKEKDVNRFATLN